MAQASYKFTGDFMLRHTDILDGLADIELRIIGRDGSTMPICAIRRESDYLEYCLAVVEGRILARGSFLQDVLKTFYLRRLASRPMLHWRLKARQKLSHSAPTVRFMLGQKTKHLFAARPSIAPPYAA
jgi:hypothetical protein